MPQKLKVQIKNTHFREQLIQDLKGLGGWGYFSTTKRPGQYTIMPPTEDPTYKDKLQEKIKRYGTVSDF